MVDFNADPTATTGYIPGAEKSTKPLSNGHNGSYQNGNGSSNEVWNWSFQQAQKQLQEHIAKRQALLQQAAGPGIDMNFVSHIDWKDETFALTFHRAVAADRIVKPKIE